MTRRRLSLYKRGGKRVLDVCLAAALIVLLVPVFAAIAVTVRLVMGAPVFYRQNRPGLHGRPFTLVKFRTMANGRSTDGRLLPDADRLTPLGRVLRALSLDELPELVNVLRGDMSLVGPRPLLTEYLPRYTQAQARRHIVRPGITGWAQINGRNSTTWEQRFRHDEWYVDHLTLALDVEILWLTLATIARREGVTAGGHATMPEFLGTKASEQNGDRETNPR